MPPPPGDNKLTGVPPGPRLPGLDAPGPSPMHAAYYDDPVYDPHTVTASGIFLPSDNQLLPSDNQPYGPYLPAGWHPQGQSGTLAAQMLQDWNDYVQGMMGAQEMLQVLRMTPQFPGHDPLSLADLQAEDPGTANTGNHILSGLDNLGGLKHQLLATNQKGPQGKTTVIVYILPELLHSLPNPDDWTYDDIKNLTPSELAKLKKRYPKTYDRIMHDKWLDDLKKTSNYTILPDLSWGNLMPADASGMFHPHVLTQQEILRGLTVNQNQAQILPQSDQDFNAAAQGALYVLNNVKVRLLDALSAVLNFFDTEDPSHPDPIGPQAGEAAAGPVERKLDVLLAFFNKFPQPPNNPTQLSQWEYLRNREDSLEKWYKAVFGEYYGDYP